MHQRDPSALACSREVYDSTKVSTLSEAASSFRSSRACVLFTTCAHADGPTS